MPATTPQAQNSTDQIKLIKLFYNKDVSESVAKSLLSIHDDCMSLTAECSSLSSNDCQDHRM